MEFNLDRENIGPIIAYFKHMIYLNHSAIETIEITESLSPISAQQLQAAKACSLQMNRMCNTFEYLIKDDENKDRSVLQNFEVKSLMEDVISQFSSTISGVRSVNIDFKTELSENEVIMLDKSKFELIILNILYCLIRDDLDKAKKIFKISISLTESKNKDRVIFTIRDNGAPLFEEEEEKPKLGYGQADSKRFSVETVKKFSLSVAQKSAKQMDGEVVYTSLKGGNRFVVSLPKMQDAPYRVSSISLYVPTYSYYNELFADIKLERILERIIKEFGGEEASLK